MVRRGARPPPTDPVASADRGRGAGEPSFVEAAGGRSAARRRLVPGRRRRPDGARGRQRRRQDRPSLRLIAGDVDRSRPAPSPWTGRLAVMRQLVGQLSGTTTARDLLVAPGARRGEGGGRRAGGGRTRTCTSMRTTSTPRSATPTPSPTGPRWAATTPRRSGTRAAERARHCDLDEAGVRPLATFSGGEQKRLALEALLRGDARRAPARRARQLPRRGRQAVARGRAASLPEDDPLRQPRPRAAGRGGHQDRHRRSQGGVDPRRFLRRLPRRPRRPGSSAWRRTRTPSTSTSASGCEAYVQEMRRRAKILRHRSRPSSRRPRAGSATSTSETPFPNGSRSSAIDVRLAGGRTGRRR